MRRSSPSCLAFAVVLLAAVPAAAQNYSILEEHLDSSRHGYTVMRVWGTAYEMGFALGVSMPDDIVAGVTSVKTGQGSNYSLLRAGMALASWTSPGVSDEIDGIVAGVLSVRPSAGIDAIDVKVVNTYGDWAYACRSHLAWGRYVTAPVKTLATRRLDFGTPFDMALHHVVVARDPSDGSPRWVNVAWPGFVTVATGINVHGTLASLHDYNSSMTANAGVVSRGIASRHVLANVTGDDLAAHLTWAQGQLGAMNLATSTFINFYSPEGHAGVFTCASGGPCGAPRVAQSDYFYGEVMLTTNAQTDGHSDPSDDSFMEEYYQAGFPKDLASHFALMGTTGLHVVSVAYRGKGDMTIMVNGRGRSDNLQLEWADLYAGSELQDAGLPDGDFPIPQDAALPDGDFPITPRDGGGADTPLTPTKDGGSCGCSATNGAGGAWLLLVVAGLLAIRRGRSRRCR
jgi:MYXO-CTERM domain-containing protein